MAGSFGPVKLSLEPALNDAGEFAVDQLHIEKANIEAYFANETISVKSHLTGTPSIGPGETDV